MFSNFIKTSVLAAVLALGGTAVAGDTGNSGSSNMQNGTQQQQGVNDQSQDQSQSLKSVRLSSLDKTQLKDVQTQLKDLGFYKGNVDGVLGTQTRGALQAFFQQQVSLIGQSRISDQALSGFGFQKSDIEKVRGVDESNGSSNVRQNTNGQDQSPSINDQNKNDNGSQNQNQGTMPQQQNQPQQQQHQQY